jgi:arylsulfatase A-like enzyme
MLRAALLCFFAASTARAADPELVMLVLVDALRADHVGAYGYAKPTTPNLDAFAKEATRYQRTYVNAPWTRPSTTSFLTGYNASRHKNQTEDSKLPAGVVTLAERMQKLGYTTAGFTANGNGGSLAGLQRGFDHFEDPGTTYPKKMRGKTYCCNGLPTGEFIVDRVKQWLATDKSQKRFVFIFFVDSHDPYGAPPELEKMFLDPAFTGEPRRHTRWEYDNAYSEAERLSAMALYDAGIRYADQAFGQLRALLESKGLYDRATIVVSADHGEGFGEHGFYLHAHHFWEEVTRVPLIARGPRFTAGAVDTRLAQSIDVPRTLVEIAGGKADDLLGRSLVAPPPADPYVISEYNEFGIHRQAIVGPRYKVVWQRPADEAWYLRTAKKKEFFPSVVFDREVVQAYDLAADPGEKQDVGASMPAEAAALLARLREFVAESERLAATP